MNSDYVIAIPTFDRANTVVRKTLETLNRGGIDMNNVYLFVADEPQRELYEKHVSKNLFKQIVVGQKGITNQRNFISNYFEEGTYVISMDDDIERIVELKNGKLHEIMNVDLIFKQGYELLQKEGLFIWGIYPVLNSGWMKNGYSTDLRFLIGNMFGFIVRHDDKLHMSVQAETKEDYEQSILYYLFDQGVIRRNNIAVKTKFKAEGGLGSDRQTRELVASEYLTSTYPNIVKRRDRQDGTPEVKLEKLPRVVYPQFLWQRPVLSEQCKTFIHNTLLPELQNTTIRNNRNRGNAGIGQSQAFGYGKKRFGRGEGLELNNNRDYARLYRLLVDFGKMAVPSDIPWTTIQVNKNYQSKPHVDKNNLGISYLVSFGEYEGGEIVVDGKDFNTCLSPIMFDASLFEHYNRPITGTKYSIIYYTSYIKTESVHELHQKIIEN